MTDCEIITGDALLLLPQLAERPSLIVTDPKYNQGVDYGPGESSDSLPPDEYLAWCRRWMFACYNALTPTGSMFVVINTEWADDYGKLLTESGFHHRNRIVWFYRFGVHQSRKFGRDHAIIRYVVKDPRQFTFNADAVRVPSARQARYKDKRADSRGRVPGDVWEIPLDNFASDVWEVPRVCGTFRERIPGFPTQLPEALVERMVLACSNAGELVADPFCGSATTLVAAKRHGRRGIGIELSPAYSESGRERLRGVEVIGG